MTPSSRKTASDSAAWLALIAALRGWMFDGAEMGVFSLVGRNAVQDLLVRRSAAKLLSAAEQTLPAEEKLKLLDSRHAAEPGRRLSWFRNCLLSMLSVWIMIPGHTPYNNMLLFWQLPE